MCHRLVLASGTGSSFGWSHGDAPTNKTTACELDTNYLNLFSWSDANEERHRTALRAKVPGVRPRSSAWRVTLFLPFQSRRASYLELHCYRIGWAGVVNDGARSEGEWRAAMESPRTGQMLFTGAVRAWVR